MRISVVGVETGLLQGGYLEVLPLLAALVLAVGVAVVAVRSRKLVAGGSLAALMLLVGFWCLTYAATQVVADPVSRLRISALSFVAIAYIPVAWLVFATDYTGRGPRLTSRMLAAILVLPTVTALFGLTAHPWLLSLSGLTGDVSATFVRGPWFWVHTVYSYVLLAAGTALLAVMFVVPGERSTDAAVVFGAAAIPWLANAVHLSGLVTFPLDPTPFAFVATGLLLAASVSKWSVFDTLPVAREVARDSVIERMDDGIIVVSEENRVLDMNPAAERVLCDVRPGESLDDARELDDVDDLPTDITLTHDGERRRYELRESSFEHLRGLVTGRLLTIHDTTRAYRRRQQLAVLNRVLRHDLRNDLNVIQGHAELITDDRGHTPDSSQIIHDKATRLVELATKVRKAEQTLGRTTNAGELDVVELVRDRVEEARREQPFAEFVCDLPDGPAVVRSNDLLGVAVDNLLENAVVHTQSLSPSVEVTVRRDASGDDPAVEIRVADEGPGIPAGERAVLLEGQETPLQHSSGIGLWLVNWIVTESAGTVSFDDNEPTGSVVTISLPPVTSGPADGGAVR